MKLRALEPADLDCFYDIENDQSMWSDSNTSAPYSRDVLQTYILTSTNDFFHDRQLRLAIEVDDICVGFADLCNFSPLHNRAEVSIALLPASRGRGYGAEALWQLCNYAQCHLHLHQLYAIVGSDNMPSNRAFRNAGFLESGTLRQWIRRPNGNFVDAHVWQFELTS